MRIAFLAAAALLAGLSSANASGGVLCEARDRAVTFSVGSPTPRAVSKLYAFAGTLQIHRQDIAESLRNLRFEVSHLAQNWSDRRELKLEVYYERNEPHGTVRLTIETRARDEGSYRGTYTLSIFDPPSDGGAPRSVTLRGRVNCSSE
jgi:hypothetical protein